ncbi:Clr5 domain-containing protein [Lasiosphaeria hispida]|uniref:Clr5 domain-containing protein n=1 Tax=Lasiosphaeria hispida TaxID=260671 RepID=A0AAJ0MLB1_9PEZI|nr:Clr5 domain-containing protein [Lasiosphaeria hispida]
MSDNDLNPISRPASRKQSCQPALSFHPQQSAPTGVVSSHAENAARVSIPTKPADWEAVKDIIEGLYIHNNVRLKDVIAAMQTAYRFRATARMYKAQFAKWNWHKYSTGPSVSSRQGGKDHSTRYGKKKKGIPRVFLAEVLRQDAETKQQLQTRLLEGEESRHLTTTMSAYRSFLLGWSEQDPRWRNATCFTKMGHYNSTMVSHFLGALIQLEQREYSHGGRLLRAAFLELEDLLLDGHVAAIWDCCVSVPQLAVNHGRSDILLTFLRYLSRLCTLRAPNHPLTNISRSTLALVEHLGTLSQISAYTTVAWRLWSDTMVALLGPDNISTLHTHRAYLLIQPEPDPTLVCRVLRDYDRLVDRAGATLGADNTTALSLEFDALLTQSRFTTPDPVTFDARLTRVLGKLVAKPGNAGLAPGRWTGLEDRQVYRGCWFLAAMYADAAGNEGRAAECRRAFLAAPEEGDWVQYALRMEEKLRADGKVGEAEEVKGKRLEAQLPRDIVEILDREEREMGGGG